MKTHTHFLNPKNQRAYLCGEGFARQGYAVTAPAPSCWRCWTAWSTLPYEERIKAGQHPMFDLGWHHVISDGKLNPFRSFTDAVKFASQNPKRELLTPINAM